MFVKDIVGTYIKIHISYSEVFKKEGNMTYNKHNDSLSNDFGPYPLVINIEKAALQNKYFRTALWTGDHLQVTLMSIKPGEEIGLEMHPDIDQFIRIEQGHGVVMMGEDKNNLDFKARFFNGYAIIIPAGTWHNIMNTGRMPIKLYSIYAPPKHPFGTVHVTKKDAEEHE